MKKMFRHITTFVFILFLTACNAMTMTHQANYGEIVNYELGQIITFPDFELEYVGKGEEPSSISDQLPPFTWHDFIITNDEETKEISWSYAPGGHSSFLGSVAVPTFFEMEGKEYVLDIGHPERHMLNDSLETRMLEENKLIIWEKEDYLQKINEMSEENSTENASNIQQYGQKISYEENQVIEWPDFELEYIGSATKRFNHYIGDLPLVEQFTYHSFNVSNQDENKVIQWNSGGELQPVLFTLSEKEFVLEKIDSIILNPNDSTKGKMAENELVIWEKEVYDRRLEDFFAQSNNEEVKNENDNISDDESPIDPFQTDSQAFNDQLEQDLTSYFKTHLASEIPEGVEDRFFVEFEPLAENTTLIGGADSKYYLWIRAKMHRGLVAEGVAIAVQVGDHRFQVTDFLTIKEMKEDFSEVEMTFPKPLIEKIKEKITD